MRLQLAGGALRPGGLRLPLGPLFPALLALPAVTSASLFSQRLGDADAAALAQAALAQAQQAQAAGPGGGGEGGLTLHNRAAPPPPTVASSLASLSLALNDIADGGAEALGGALQAGALPALEVLDVRACHISPRGLALLDPSRWARGEGASRRGVLLADHQI